METSPYLLMALLTLCMITSALSLQCYECTNAPGSVGVPKCDSDHVGKRTCDEISNKCMTMTYNYTFLTSQSVETKNCSSSLACDPQFDFSWCKLFEITGLVSNCMLDCCQGDLCNGPSNSTVTPPTSAVLELAASFGTIFSALTLTMFVGWQVLNRFSPYVFC